MVTCDRCGAKVATSVVSYFNTDELCMACKDDERHAPGYVRAVEMENDAVRRGDYNYEGMGLFTEDRVFLEERRKARHHVPPRG